MLIDGRPRGRECDGNDKYVQRVAMANGAGEE